MSKIKVENLSYTYSKGTPFEMAALKNINLEIENGEFVAIIGHTGSGKSTLIQHLNALITPQTGKIYLDDKDINESKTTARDARFKIGLCFQYPEYQLFEETVFKDIAFGPKNMGLNKDEVAEKVIKAARYTSIPSEMLEKSPFDLSGGEKRRVAIAGVLAMEPEVLVMDEPAAGLDPRGRKEIFSLIKNYREKTGSTVIIVSHSMDDVAKFATRVIVLDHGEIAIDGDVDYCFSRADELVKMGLDIPQMTYIVRALREKGYDIRENIYTVDECYEELLNFAKKNGGKIGK